MASKNKRKKTKMKKLMVAVVVAAVAIASHAASMSWNSGTMYFDKDSGSTSSGTKLNATSNKGTGNLYNITKGQYDAILALLVTEDTYNTANALTVYNNAVKGDYGKSAATATSTKGGTIALTDGTTDNPEGLMYALVTYEIGTGDDKYVTASVGAYDLGPTAGLLDNVGLKVGGDAGTVATKWTAAAVPEPTSGLLLLLGMAGLALRRRRA